MIYDTQALKNIYSNYTNVNQKVSLDTKNKKITRIKRGLYSDDIIVDSPVISNVCRTPSYLSFEYALCYYGLIPEYVSVYTSATYGKKNNKSFILEEVSFIYKSIPKEVFSKGITFLENENNIKYKIATKEKALCDQLYSKYPVRSIKEIKIMLFDDLRIDIEELKKLDFEFIFSIANLYHSNTVNTFVKYLKEELLK